jgi:serine/threonine protein kinase
MGKCWTKNAAVGILKDEAEEGAAPGQGPQGGPGTVVVASKSMFAFSYAVGKSSYGVVWKATKKSNKQDYAIKIMDKATVYNMRSVDCMQNELKLLSVLRDPFIVNMHYAFQEKGQLYLVTRYNSGGDLRYHMDMRKRSKRMFAENEAQYIIACIILALEYLHDNGVIHRDVRPENIVLNSRGLCKLCDFQLARVWREDNSSDTSGSVGYCSPEVLAR